MTDIIHLVRSIYAPVYTMLDIQICVSKKMFLPQENSCKCSNPVKGRTTKLLKQI